MTAPIKQASFAGGEISPLMYARTDQVKYETGLRTMRNMQAMRHGGATRRPGTQYIATTLNNGNPVRLIEFVFNETGTGQSYVLEFGSQYIAFYQNGGVVTSGGNPYTIVTPYIQEDLFNLKFEENNDIITIVHPSYPIRELQRLGATNWKLVPVPIGSSVTTPTLTSAIGGIATLTKQYYAITVVAASGEESLPSTRVLASAGGADSSNPVALAWTAVSAASGAVSYRIYKSLGNANDALGYIGTVVSNAFSDFGITPDFSNSPPISFDPFSAINLQSTVPSVTSYSTQFKYAISPYTYIYAVEATTPAGTSFAQLVFSSNAVAPSGSNVYTFSWDAIPGATAYHVYRNAGNGSVANSDFGVMIVGVVGTTFTDDGSVAPNTGTNPSFHAPSYPSVVGFSQQRRYFGATIANQIGFWGSQPGFFYNFNVHSIPVDSDCVFGSLAGNQMNSIQAIMELKAMLMLSSGAEVYVQGNGSGVVTPAAINASIQSQYGCSTLRPIKVADLILFNQALGSFIRDLSFDFAINGYRGNDITVFSSHLFEGYSIVDWSYQKIPDSILWAVRSDGVLLSCTYVREQQMNAWARHDFTNGTVESVCAIPENGQYAVYVSMKRTINGSTVRYIERLSSRIWTDELNATYLDCFLQYNGTNTSAITMTLSAPSGTFTDDGTAYQQNLTLRSSSAFFNSAMVGDQIFLSDQDFVLNMGNMVDPENDGSSFALSADGNQIRCMIMSFVSSTEVVVTPNRAVPATLQNVAMTTWARAVRTVTGLTHLIGQEVAVWADRTVVGSPLNTTITSVYTVSATGTLTLDKCYAVIYVGLPMVSDLETLDLETSFGETMIGRRKRQSKLGAYIYNTRNFWAGSENPDSNFANTEDDDLFELSELKNGINRLNYDQPPELMTEQQTLAEVTRWNKNGRIFIRNVDPTPMTILAVVPGGDSPTANPAYEKV